MGDNNEGRSYGSKNQNYGQSRQWQGKAALPDGYLRGGYYADAEKQKLKKEYVVEFPKKIAELLEGDGGRDANKRTQIRKYYEYLLRVDKKMQLSSGFPMVEADLAELIPYVKYAGSRKVVSPLFISFIEKNVEAVRDEKDMRAFVKHFEAVIAFTKKG